MASYCTVDLTKTNNQKELHSISKAESSDLPDKTDFENAEGAKDTNTNSLFRIFDFW